MMKVIFTSPHHRPPYTAWLIYHTSDVLTPANPTELDCIICGCGGLHMHFSLCGGKKDKYILGINDIFASN